MVNTTIFRRLPVFFFGLFILLPALSQGQDSDRLPKEFHKSRREALLSLLPEGAVAVIFSNPVRNRNNDVDFQYSQNPDLYYLTGLTDPDAALLLFRNPVKINNKSISEILFAEAPNKGSSTWSKDLPPADVLADSLGIQIVIPNEEIGNLAGKLCGLKILLSWPESPRKASHSNVGLPFLVAALKSTIDSCHIPVDSLSLSKDMAKLREVKQPEELVLMKKAIELTINGFNDLMLKLEPGWKEYQAQAVVEYNAKMGGSEYQGYPSISGGGGNACVLHYTENRSELNAGELLLADMGAEYHGYTADITRTLPVSGKFTADQLLLYNIVLRAQEAGIKACLAGSPFTAAHIAAKNEIIKGLTELGIIKEPSEVMRYFMHGTSHYLGLDVHDAGTKGELKPNTVITVEPGIYIRKGDPCDPRWWGTGIRIEDDILITTGEPVNLSGALPRLPSDIERVMASPHPK